MTISMNTIFNKSARLYLLKMIGLLAAFLVNVFLIGELDLSSYGLYVYYISILQITCNLVTGGINGYVSRYFPDRLSIDANREGSNDTFLLLIFVAKSLFAITILILLIKEIELRQLIIVAFIFQVIRIFFEGILKSTLNNEISSKMSLTAILVRNGLIVWLLDEINLEILITIEICVHAIWVVLFLTLLITSKVDLHLRFKRSIKSEISSFELRYLGLSWLNEILNSVTNRSSDIILVRYFTDPHFLGIYSLALRNYEYIVKILPSKEVLVYVRSYMLASIKSTDIKFVIKEYQKLFYYVSLIYMIPVAMFFIVGKLFIRDVYGVQEYDYVYIITCILLVYQLNYALFYHQSLIVLYLRKIEYSLYTRLIYPIVLLLYVLIESSPSMEAFVVITILCELFRNFVVSTFLIFKKQNAWNYDMLIGFVGLIVVPSVVGLLLPKASYSQILISVLSVLVYIILYVYFIGYGNVKESMESALGKIFK